jgi:hypothetical protein
LQPTDPQDDCVVQNEHGKNNLNINEIDSNTLLNTLFILDAITSMFMACVIALEIWVNLVITSEIANEPVTVLPAKNALRTISDIAIANDTILS